LAPDLSGGDYSAPLDLLFKGPTSKRREGEGKGKRGRKREREQKGRKGGGERLFCCKFLATPLHVIHKY